MPKTSRNRQPAHPAQPLVPPLPKKAFSVAEAAEIMSIGETNLRALIREKRLKVVRIGKKGRGISIPLVSIDEFFSREAS